MNNYDFSCCCRTGSDEKQSGSIDPTKNHHSWVNVSPTNKFGHIKHFRWDLSSNLPKHALGRISTWWRIDPHGYINSLYIKFHCREAGWRLLDVTNPLPLDFSFFFEIKPSSRGYSDRWLDMQTSRSTRLIMRPLRFGHDFEADVRSNRKWREIWTRGSCEGEVCIANEDSKGRLTKCQSYMPSCRVHWTPSTRQEFKPTLQI